MVHVSWYGSVAYCNWRSDQEGYEACYDLSTWECDFSKNGLRLPTEAEWEYAARGGQYSPYFGYPWGNTIEGSQANFGNSGDPFETGSRPWTAPVGYYDGGQIPAGEDMGDMYGLYDMAGNVWEWCNDWYEKRYYDKMPEDGPWDNPKGPLETGYRSLRGGGWTLNSEDCQVAKRLNDGFNPDGRYYIFGFRVCAKVGEY